MCQIVDMYELRESPQKGMAEKIENECLLKESIGTTENVSCDKDYFFETRNSIKDIETIPAKITILHTRKESILMKSEEDPIKPWYFTHV